MKHKMQQQNKFLRDVIDSIPNPFYVIDVRDYTIKIANRKAYAGKIPDGLTCHLLTHRSHIPCDSKEHPCPLKEVLSTKKPVIVEHMHYDERGELRNVEVHGYPVFDAEENIVQYIETSIDITERKEAERDISFLASIIRNMHEAVCAVDHENKVVFWNESAERIFGYRSEEIIGKSAGIIIPEELQGEVSHCLSRLHEEGRISAYESVRISKDGKKFPVEVTAVPLYDEDRQVKGCAAIIKDISYRKKTEEELLKASRIESIGVLAGGIAHDFNNLLTAILSSISTAKDMAGEGEIRELLSIAQGAARNAKDLTFQLLSFARGGAPVRETTSIADLLRESTKFVMRGSNIKNKLFIEDNLWPVEMDKAQITQVIHNLALNAREAMHEGGVVTILAENHILTKKDNLPLKEGGYVKISVRDQGPGIPKEIVQKIFDPYFTTKKMGVKKGTGLGLALCYMIVKNHEGFITVDSKVGEGATFTFYLPASAGEQPAEIEEEHRLIPGKGRVLIMDDEEIIEKIAGIMFRRIGYEITFARDGRETVELYERAMESGRRFDIVILDLTIPGEEGGRETIRKLVEIDPEVRAIVSSGHTKDPVMSNFRQYGFRGVLPKPYEVEELSEEVHKVLKGQD